MARSAAARRRTARNATGLAGVALLAGLSSPAPGGSRERVRLERERAVLEVEAGNLDAAQASAFADLADRGVVDIESLVGASLPGWAKRTGRVRFVVGRGVAISRTYGRTVFLPLARVKTRSAPYLHETVHALVPARGDRTWLSEGLACYLESFVSETRSGYDAHVFTSAGDRDIHTAARRTLGSERGRAVLPWVGGRGDPPWLEEDRSGVARPFYVLSHSFTKHVVEAAGLDAVVRALVGGGLDAMARSTRRSEEEWKRDWLAALG